MTVESRGSFSKAGYGKASCFPREEAESLSHCTESTCFTPRDQRREAACPLTARAESQQRAALGVAEEGRVEPKPGTTVSRVPPCTLLFPSCIRSVPAAGGEAEQHVPAAPWDRHTRTARVRVPAVTLELRCVCTGLILAKDFPGSQLFIPTLGKGGMRETEDGARETRDKPPLTAPMQAGGCQLSTPLSCHPPLPTSNK